MKQETAVQWLVSKLYDYPWDDISDRRITEALEMEKQQSIELLTKYHDGLFHLPFKDGEAEAIYNHLTQ